MSRTVESALGDVELETLTSRAWGAALAVALGAHLGLAETYAAWERARALAEAAETETRIDVRLGPPGGRIETAPPPPLPPGLPPDQVAQPSRTERAADAPPITPTAPPPPAPEGAPLSSAVGEGGGGLPAPPVVEPEVPPAPPTPPAAPPIAPAELKAYANRAVGLIHERIVYPPSALRNQLEGRAVLVLTVDRRGRLVRVRVAEGTGHEPLDEAILKATNGVPNFGRLPDGYTEPTLSFSAAIRFMLVE